MNNPSKHIISTLSQMQSEELAQFAHALSNEILKTAHFDNWSAASIPLAATDSIVRQIREPDDL
jgi:hypothetical protein